MRFRAEQRLRRQHDFRHLREKGRRIDGGVFTLWWHRRDRAETVVPPRLVRVGVVASTAGIGSAVRRNAAKRRLREVFRRNQALIPPGTDLLLVARPSLNELAFHDVESKFIAVCRRLTGDEA